MTLLCLVKYSVIIINNEMMVDRNTDMLIKKSQQQHCFIHLLLSQFALLYSPLGYAALNQKGNNIIDKGDETLWQNDWHSAEASI